MVQAVEDVVDLDGLRNCVDEEHEKCQSNYTSKEPTRLQLQAL
jgi:hypothetical protein